MYAALLHDPAESRRADTSSLRALRLGRRGDAGRGPARLRGRVRRQGARGLRAVGDDGDRVLQPPRPRAQARLDRPARCRRRRDEGSSTTTGARCRRARWERSSCAGPTVMKRLLEPRGGHRGGARRGRLVPDRRHGPGRRGRLLLHRRPQEGAGHPRRLTTSTRARSRRCSTSTRPSREAAVLGVPHESLGEEVAAAVVLKDGEQATPEELRDHVKESVAAYKYPRRSGSSTSCPRVRRGRSSSARSSPRPTPDGRGASILVP